MGTVVAKVRSSPLFTCRFTRETFISRLAGNSCRHAQKHTSTRSQITLTFCSHIDEVLNFSGACTQPQLRPTTLQGECILSRNCAPIHITGGFFFLKYIFFFILSILLWTFAAVADALPHNCIIIFHRKMSHFFGVSFESWQYLLRTEALSKLSGILTLLKVNSSRQGVDLTAVRSQQISQIWAFTSGVWSRPTNYKKYLYATQI